MKINLLALIKRLQLTILLTLAVTFLGCGKSAQNPDLTNLQKKQDAKPTVETCAISLKQKMANGFFDFKDVSDSESYKAVVKAANQVLHTLPARANALLVDWDQEQKAAESLSSERSHFGDSNQVLTYTLSKRASRLIFTSDLRSILKGIPHIFFRQEFSTDESCVLQLDKSISEEFVLNPKTMALTITESAWVLGDSLQIRSNTIAMDKSVYFALGGVWTARTIMNLQRQTEGVVFLDFEHPKLKLEIVYVERIKHLFPFEAQPTMIKKYRVSLKQADQIFMEHDILLHETSDPTSQISSQVDDITEKISILPNPWMALTL